MERDYWCLEGARGNLLHLCCEVHPCVSNKQKGMIDEQTCGCG